jgi:hypothetical protein
VFCGNLGYAELTRVRIPIPKAGRWPVAIPRAGALDKHVNTVIGMNTVLERVVSGTARESTAGHHTLLLSFDQQPGFQRSRNDSLSLDTCLWSAAGGLIAVHWIRP